MTTTNEKWDGLEILHKTSNTRFNFYGYKQPQFGNRIAVLKNLKTGNFENIDAPNENWTKYFLLIRK